MKLISLFIPVLSVMAIACQNKSPDRLEDYTLIDDGGVFVEQFDPENTNENRYTANNLVFREGTQFTYLYEHITADNDTLYFEQATDTDDWAASWRFVSSDSANKNTVKKIKVLVEPGLQPVIKTTPDYNQTVVTYEYLTENGRVVSNSTSGVIENEGNVWMHPPRDHYFEILELNPFPFIKTPYEVGNDWNYSLIIGDTWGNQRWKTWEGTIKDQCHYQIVNKKRVPTVFGDLTCHVTASVAKSRLGETKLTSYFNPEYGFVKLHYTNIDGSKTHLELIEHSKINTVSVSAQSPTWQW